jgi:hypothetical protein
MALFYVTQNNSLSSWMWNKTWNRIPMFIPLEVDARNRHLKVWSSFQNFPGSNKNMNFFLLTQRPGAGASLILLSSNSSDASWTWKDITSELNGSNSTRKYAFNAPFGVSSANVSFNYYSPFLEENQYYPWVGVFANEVGDESSNLVGAAWDGNQLTSGRC